MRFLAVKMACDVHKPLHRRLAAFFQSTFETPKKADFLNYAKKNTSPGKHRIVESTKRNA